MQTAELVAGRELDARVAERVIGRFIQRIDWEGGYFDRDTVVQLNDDGDTWSIVPYYSTDISAAWQVVEHLGMTTKPHGGTDAWVLFWKALDGGRELLKHNSAGAALAICHAALAALNHE